MIKSFIQWVVYSSADPRKVSLAIKGAGLYVSSLVVPVLGLLGHVITPDTWNASIDNVASAVEYILTAVSYVIMGYGSIRKVFLTIRGTNHQ